MSDSVQVGLEDVASTFSKISISSRCGKKRVMLLVGCLVSFVYITWVAPWIALKMLGAIDRFRPNGLSERKMNLSKFVWGNTEFAFGVLGRSGTACPPPPLCL